MKMVNSFNDFGKLEEIIIGTAQGLTIPSIDISSQHFFEAPEEAKHERLERARLDKVIKEIEEDFDGLKDTLERYGVTVKRPNPIEFDVNCTTPHWQSQQGHALMPRDCLAVIGNTIIEAPMPSRSRYFESLSYRHHIEEYFQAGSGWFSGPKPILTDDVYQYKNGVPILNSKSPLFDAANLLRCGKDIFFNISNSGNEIAVKWLRQVLGGDFNVHPVSLCSDHIGTTLHVLRPGLLLANQERLTKDMLPEQFSSWDIIWFNEPTDPGFGLDWARASVWIGMNILSLNEKTVLIEENQHVLADQLVSKGIEPVPVRFRHGRTVGGGFHCCSLDTIRQSDLVNIF